MPLRIGESRVFCGPESRLPQIPNSFEVGRVYFCTDTKSLFIGTGLTTPMQQVLGSGDFSYDPETDTIDDGRFV
jgi:hypothetical protein